MGGGSALLENMYSNTKSKPGLLWVIFPGTISPRGITSKYTGKLHIVKICFQIIVVVGGAQQPGGCFLE